MSEGNPDTPLQRRLLTADVYEMLKGMILDQRIPPDEKLSIDLLARQLGVSQTPVREALARLDGDGLVVKGPHRRYWTAPMLTRKTYTHLYDVRLRLEPFAANEAAKFIKPDEIERLEQTCAAMEHSRTGGVSSEYGVFTTNDALLHDTIAGASRNDFLRDAIKRLHSHFQLARLYRDYGIIDAKAGIRDHRGIVDALKRGDGVAASERMYQHIERSRDELKYLLEKQIGDEPPSPT